MKVFISKKFTFRVYIYIYVKIKLFDLHFKSGTLLDLCVSSWRRGHANLPRSIRKNLRPPRTTHSTHCCKLLLLLLRPRSSMHIRWAMPVPASAASACFHSACRATRPRGRHGLRNSCKLAAANYFAQLHTAEGPELLNRVFVDSGYCSVLS